MPRHFGGETRDLEADDDDYLMFEDKSIRMAFVRKVYLTLTVQVAFTTGIIALMIFCEPVQNFIEDNGYLRWLAVGILFATVITITCCGSVRRSFPCNFLLLGLFTLAESFLCGVMAGYYDMDAVLMAAGITCVVCLALTLFALQTKWDFTAFAGILLGLTVVLIIFGIALIFIRSPIAHLVYACLGALLFCIYLVMDTQLIMGGAHKYSIAPDEVVFAALTLYTDVMMIFTYLLNIIGLSRNM